MFDELKIKSLLKKNLSEDKYKELSFKIRSDPRVVKHLIRCNPSAISVVDRDVDISSLVLADYSLVKYLNYNQLNLLVGRFDFTYFKMSKETFKKLSEANKNMMFKKNPSVFINYFDDKRKRKLISEIISVKVRGEKTAELYDIFTDEELKKVILNLESTDLVYLFEDRSHVKKYVSDVIASLSKEELMNLYGRCNEVYSYLSKETQQAIDIYFTEGNFLKILKLDVDTQVKFFIDNPHLLRCASSYVIRKFVETIDTLSCEELVLNKNKGLRTDIHKLKDEDFIKIASSNFQEMYWYCYFKKDKVDYLKKFIFKKIEGLDDLDKQKQLMKLYDSLNDTIIFPSEVFIYYREKYQISKLLFDENVIKNNSVELFQRYKDTFDRNLLIKILSNAYGKHVEEIFTNRPKLNILDIDNFRIFDKDIYNVLGKNFVDYTLNCFLGLYNYLIYEISNDSELLQSFNKYFKVMTGDIEKLDINIISNLIEKFMIHKNIFREVDFDNLSSERKSNINLMINDIDLVTVCVSSIEDLDNYVFIRNRRFMEIVDSLDDVSKVRDIIFAYVTNREVIDKDGEYDGEYTLENLTFDLIIKTFDIMNIIKNDELIKKMNLNNDDVSLLLLLHEVARIRDIDVLKNTFKALVSREMDVKLSTPTLEKIRNYCINDVKKNLLSNDVIEKMDKKVIDGVEVVNLEGEDFVLITSVTGVNLSTNLPLNAMFGKKLLYDWLYREGGINTISTALCSSDTSVYPAPITMWKSLDGHISFVFGSDVDIVGMGGSDISSSHVSKSRKHSFNYMLQSDFGFSLMNDLKKRINKNSGNTNGSHKFNSEITIARFEEDIRKEKSGNRKMPIGIYVVGEISPKVLETAKVFNDYYEKNKLGKFRIIQVNPKKYKDGGYNGNNSNINDYEIGFASRR